MKIKDVMELTDLTDRAIRLYIQSGLISPQNQRSYAGRNHYDFSQEDVAALKKISLLRKAEFSIEEILKMQQGNRETAVTLFHYLDRKRQEVTDRQKILSCLEEVSCEKEISVDKICRSLSKIFSNDNTKTEEEDKVSPWMVIKEILKWTGIIIAYTLAVIVALILLCLGIFKLAGYGQIYETTRISDYMNIKGNFDNDTPEDFICAFLPEEVENAFSEVMYHYKAKKGDAYAYECYLEFVINDPAAYEAFKKQYIDVEKCVPFAYDSNFMEQSISNVLFLQEPDSNAAVYAIGHAQLGKILFSDQQKRIIFVAMGMYDGGGANTTELGHFFLRFQIDPWDYSRSAYASNFYQEQGITNMQR